MGINAEVAGLTQMFPKQPCPVCQNRSCGATTSGIAIAQNKQMKIELQAYKDAVKNLETYIDELEAKLGIPKIYNSVACVICDNPGGHYSGCPNA